MLLALQLVAAANTACRPLRSGLLALLEFGSLLCLGVTVGRERGKETWLSPGGTVAQALRLGQRAAASLGFGLPPVLIGQLRRCEAVTRVYRPLRVQVLLGMMVTGVDVARGVQVGGVRRPPCRDPLHSLPAAGRTGSPGLAACLYCPVCLL